MSDFTEIKPFTEEELVKLCKEYTFTQIDKSYLKITIMTAEELLQGEDCVLETSYNTDFVVEKMKEYARFHVKMALKKAKEADRMNRTFKPKENKRFSITNSYKLSNII